MPVDLKLTDVEYALKHKGDEFLAITTEKDFVVVCVAENYAGKPIFACDDGPDLAKEDIKELYIIEIS